LTSKIILSKIKKIERKTVKVIVKFLNGREIRGNAIFFNIQKMSFPLQVQSQEGKIEIQHVSLDTVKKILFLRKEPGSEHLIHIEKIDQSQFVSPVAFKLCVEFKDKEIITGTTLRYNPQEKGFFLTPLNPGDISERIYVNAKAVKDVDQVRLLGKILTDDKKIRTEQLDHALKCQHEIRSKKIGTIMVEEEMINEKQLDESLQKQKEHQKLLGEILVRAGYITPAQLKRALQIQQENRKKKLGQILVELKYLAPNDICIALASQLNCPWIDLSSIQIHADMATLLPEDIVRELELVPVKKRDGDILVVATSDPNLSYLKQEISKYTSLKIELVIAYDGYLESAMQRYFPKRE
jgi:hypothetical protein